MVTRKVYFSRLPHGYIAVWGATYPIRSEMKKMGLHWEGGAWFGRATPELLSYLAEIGAEERPARVGYRATIEPQRIYVRMIVLEPTSGLYAIEPRISEVPPEVEEVWRVYREAMEAAKAAGKSPIGVTSTAVNSAARRARELGMAVRVSGYRVYLRIEPR